MLPQRGVLRVSDDVQILLEFGAFLLVAGLWGAWAVSGPRDQNNVPGGLTEVFCLFAACLGGFSLVGGISRWLIGS